MSTLTISPGESSTLAKLAALACHPSTGDHEWEAAAVAFFRLHRKAGSSPAGQPDRLDVSAFVSSANAFWQNRAPATRKPSGPIWTPTAEDGNLKYPGLDIAEILMRDMEYAVELNAEHHRRREDAKKKKTKSPRH